MTVSRHALPAVFGNVLALGAFLGSSTLAAAEALPCPELTPAQYQRFVDIALQDEDANDVRNFVIRWDSGIRMQVLGNPTPVDEANLQLVLDDLAALAPAVSIERIGADDKDANFFIHYVPIESYGGLIESWGAPLTNLATACATFYYWRQGGEIVEVRMLLPTNAAAHGCGAEATTMADYAVSLTREEVTQAFGLPNDVTGERESIFDQVWSPRDYSPTDRLIIRALYCEDVRAGMTEAALWPILVPGAEVYLDLLEQSAEGAMAPDDVAALQSLLTEMGYKVGVFDGALNPDTISAAADVRERLIVK